MGCGSEKGGRLHRACFRSWLFLSSCQFVL